jgi:hypothetical protein
MQNVCCQKGARFCDRYRIDIIVNCTVASSVD